MFISVRRSFRLYKHAFEAQIRFSQLYFSTVPAKSSPILMPYVMMVPINDPAIPCLSLPIELLAMIWAAVKIKSGQNAMRIAAGNACGQYDC